MLTDTVRFVLTYSGPSQGSPESLVGKFPARDDAVRARILGTGVYDTEAMFYEQIRDKVSIRAPHCYYVALNRDTHEFGLLIEDATPARSLDPFTGCPFSDAERAMREIAALHAPSYCNPEYADMVWLQNRTPIMRRIAQGFPDFLALFRERNEGLIEPEFVRVAECFANRLEHFAFHNTSRFCVVHGDYRTDNMLFDAQGGAVPLMILDWQTLAIESPGIDTSYFLSSSYSMNMRARDERELLRIYHREMIARGVSYDWDALWHDYCRSAWLGVFQAIVAAAMGSRSERGDQLFLRMMRGAAQMMLELGTLDID